MTWHLHGAIVTHHGAAANNRGENEGNLTTLQKLLWKDSIHTTVSAEAIRWALRYFWQTRSVDDPSLATNRRWDDQADENTWEDPYFKAWGDPAADTYIDDDVLGFMRAEAAKRDASDPADDTGGKKVGAKKSSAKKSSANAKGTIDKRRGVLEFTRAVSLTPFAGDVTFNAKSGAKGRTSLYSTELHATRYQYSFSMTPSRLRERARAFAVVEGIVRLGEVAGNHSRFLYDFSPDALILRWTHDPAPRLLYSFDEGQWPPTVDELVRRVAAGDIAGDELIIGGVLTTTEHGKMLRKAGAELHAGVLAAATAVKARMESSLGEDA